MTKLHNTTTVMYRKFRSAIVEHDDAWSLIYPIVGIGMIVGMVLTVYAGDYAYGFVFVAGAWLASIGMDLEQARHEESDRLEVDA